jgi:hypothetical protein
MPPDFAGTGEALANPTGTIEVGRSPGTWEPGRRRERRRTVLLGVRCPRRPPSPQALALMLLRS